jgi:hypothetical protein
MPIEEPIKISNCASGTQGHNSHVCPGSLYNYDTRALTGRKELPKIHHDSVHEKTETRDVMVGINPDCNYDEVTTWSKCRQSRW